MRSTLNVQDHHNRFGIFEHNFKESNLKKTRLTLAEVQVDAEGLWRFASGNLSTPECEGKAK